MLKKICGLMGMLALLLSGAGWAECPQPATPAAQNCTEQAAIAAFLGKEHSCYTGYILSFNHKNPDPQSRWKGWRSTDGKLRPQGEKDGFEVDFTGKPKWELDSSKKFLVLVTDTNPLVFGTEFTGGEEATVEGLAEIQKLAGLVGGFFTGAVGAAAQLDSRFVELALPDSTSALVWRVDEPSVRSYVENQDRTQRDAIARVRRLADEIKLLASCLSKGGFACSTPTLREFGETPAARNEPAPFAAAIAVQSKATAVGDVSANVEREIAAVQGYAQQVESGTSPSATLVSRNLGDLVGSVGQVFEELSTAKSASIKAPFQCTAGIAAIAEAAETILRQPCLDCLDRSKASERLIELRNDPLTTPKLTAKNCGQLTTALAILGAKFVEVDQLTEPARAAVIGLIRPTVDDLLKAASGYGKNVTQRAENLKTVTELEAKRGTLTKSAARLAQVVARETSALRLGSSPSCALTQGVLLVHRGEGNALDLPWSKTRTEKFKIASDPAFKDQLVLTHSDNLELSYSLENQRFFDLGVDAGLVYTELKQPKWAAEEVPDPADPTKKIMVIAANGSESRAGEVALFLDLEPRPWQRHDSSWRWGFQIGAGVNTDHPALFAGVKVQWKFLRLGLGTTFQEIQELDGKKIGDTVASKDAIPLRDDYGKSKTYLSLTIAIDDLPFWNAGGDE